ncbi:hypothetical protein F5X99DRAFT_429431 [Biscogniauxia marginata]|nr:hypothetical protein F5X99DRAFT_429431 [Biscogniauxia marginata]
MPVTRSGVNLIIWPRKVVHCLIVHIHNEVISHEALRTGAVVRMLDHAAKPGENSKKASSGINSAGTQFQKQIGITKDGSFYPDTVRSAGTRFAEGCSSSWEEYEENGSEWYEGV